MHDYGIQNEGSHVRAHVCVVVGRVYFYATQDALTILRNKKYRQVSGYQQGVETATSRGWLVPAGEIPGCGYVDIPRDWLNHPVMIKQDDSTTVKGEKAARIVKRLFELGKVPALWDSVKLVHDRALQVDGVDIRIDLRIQVKCDFTGGPKALGGSGYLFLQSHEVNPLGKH